MISRIIVSLVLLAAPALAQVEQVTQITKGWCSPAVASTGGNVTITCSGVDPKALARLNELLNKKDLELADKVREAEEWARRYHALEGQLAEFGNTSGLARQAKAALEEGELEEAGKALFDDYYNRGNMYRKERDYQKAITNYERAIRSLRLSQNPDHFGVHYNLANLYGNIGDVDKAIIQFQKAIKIKPNDIEAIYNLARMYRQNGERDLAKENFRRVIELAPEKSDLWNRAKENLRSLGG